eukprot:Clim_evm7s77 gene=Clim_evmTU7s77
MTTYNPSTLVEAMHDLPRLRGGNTFEPTESNYWVGIGLILLPWAILVIPISCIMLCGPTSRKHYYANRRATNLGRLFWLMALFLVFAAIIVALVGNINALTSVDSATSDLTDAANLLQNAEDGMTSIQGSIGTISSDLDTLSAACAAGEEEIADVQAQVATLNGTVNDFLNAIGDTPDDIILVSNKTSNTSKVPFAIFIAVLLFVLVFVIGCAFVLVDVCRRRSFNTTRNTKISRWMLRVGTTAFIFVFLGTFVFMAYTATGSDYCIDPDTNTVALVNKFSGAEEDLLMYYITCEGTNELEGDLEQAQSDVTTGLAFVELIPASCGSSTVDSLTTELNNIQTNLVSLEEDVQCEPVQQLYQSFAYDHVCDESIEAYTILWVTCLFMSIMLICLCLTLWKVAVHEEEDMDKMPMGEKATYQGYA